MKARMRYIAKEYAAGLIDFDAVDIVIQLVEADVREQLAGEVADRHTYLEKPPPMWAAGSIREGASRRRRPSRK